MRRGFPSSLAALCLGAGVALAQPLPPPRQVAADSAASAALAQGRKSEDTVAPYLLDGASSPNHPTPGRAAEPACDALGDAGENAPTSLWASAEYLLWRIKDAPAPVPLVTTSPPASLGVLGNPGTGVLFGGSEIEYRASSGARFTLGLWSDGDQTAGFEASGFFLEKRPVTFAAGSTTTGIPLLARPFVNPLTGAETALLVSAPDQFTGNVAVRAAASLYGWEADFLRNLTRRGCFCIDLLAGFRYVHLEEELDIGQSSTLLPGGTAGVGGMAIVPPATIDVFDKFVTRNEFYGGQLGARAEYLRGRLFIHVQGKVAAGATHEVGFISGVSSLSGTGSPTTTIPAGLLAVSSNSGRTVHDEFSVIPEVGLNIGYDISPHVRVFAGYTFLYWTDVARPSDLVNRTVNPTLVPASQAFSIASGPAQPQSSLQRADFWAQGVNFGLEVRY